jgi:hypothetical protein
VMWSLAEISTSLKQAIKKFIYFGATKKVESLLWRGLNLPWLLWLVSRKG